MSSDEKRYEGSRVRPLGAAIIPPGNGPLRYYGTNSAGALGFWPLSLEEVILGALAPGGVYYPGEFIGPQCTFTSGASVTGLNGTGYKRFKKAGTLSFLSSEQAQASGSTLDVHIYAGPDPTLLSFTGVVLQIVGGALVSDNTSDTITVVAGDCFAVYNPAAFGFTPHAMQLTAYYQPEV